MISDDDLARFYRPFMAAQSVDAYRKHFPRWRSFLLAEGLDHVPSPLSTAPADVQAINLLCLLARQGAAIRDPAIEHQLRNAAGVRPCKA